jgi:hypothetical protein
MLLQSDKNPAIVVRLRFPLSAARTGKVAIFDVAFGSPHQVDYADEWNLT